MSDLLAVVGELDAARLANPPSRVEPGLVVVTQALNRCSTTTGTVVWLSDDSPTQSLHHAAVEAIVQIAKALQDRHAVDATDELTGISAELAKLNENLAARDVARAAAALSTDRKLIDLESWSLWHWTQRHPLSAFLLSAFPLWFVILHFWILPRMPLVLLHWNEALSNMDFNLPGWLGGAKVPFRKFPLLIGFYHYHAHVLAAWVAHHAGSARSKLASLDFVRQRETYVSLPVLVHGQPVTELTPARFRDISVRKRWCVLVRGEGGSGKTTLALQIARWALADEPSSRLCPERQMLPVVLDPTTGFDVREELTAFKEEVRGCLRMMIGSEKSIPEGLFERLLEDRRVLVILDGLSEMAHSTASPTAARPQNPGFPVNALIATSRSHERNLQPDLIIEPLRIDNNHLLPFINTYLSKAGHQELTDSELFEASRRLSDLVTAETGITPLFARLFAERLVDLQERGEPISSLPKSVPELMLAYLNSLNRRRRAEEPDDTLVHVAAKIAAWHCLKETYMPGQLGSKADIVDALAKCGANTKLLDDLEARLRILRTVGSDRLHVRFELDPLAEYLAAMKAVDELGSSETEWLKFLEDADSKPGAPQSIRGFLSAVRDCIAALTRPTVPTWIGEQLDNRVGLDAEVVNSARRQRRVQHLIQYLQSHEAIDRLYASEQLLEIEADITTAIPALVTALGDEDEGVRENAQNALALIGKDAVPAVVEALQSDNPDVRQAATWILGEIGADAVDAIEALAATLRTETDSDVRRSVLGALSQIDGATEESLKAFVVGLEDIDPGVRADAAYELGCYGADFDATTPALIGALADNDPRVRGSAAWALRAIGPRAQPAKAALISALRDSDPDIRGRAADALGSVGDADESVITSLTSALDDLIPQVRVSSAVALSSVGISTHKAVDVVIGALALGDPEVRARAATALGDIAADPTDTVPALVASLKDPNEQVRIAAIRTVGKIGPAASKAASELIAIVESDGHNRERDEAVSALGRIGDPAAVPALRSLLSSTLGFTQIACAVALTRMGVPPIYNSLPVVLEALKDDNSAVRFYAAGALGEIGLSTPGVVAALRSALQDAMPEVREAAATALEILEEKRAPG